MGSGRTNGPGADPDHVDGQRSSWRGMDRVDVALRDVAVFVVSAMVASSMTQPPEETGPTTLAPSRNGRW